MIDLVLLLQAGPDIQAACDRYKDFQAGRGALFMRQKELTMCHIPSKQVKIGVGTGP